MNISPLPTDLSPPAQGRVLIAFLRRGKALDRWSGFILIGACLVLAWRLIDRNHWRAPDILLVASLVLALAEKLYAWRVALDAELFGSLYAEGGANAAALHHLDVGLGRVLGTAPLPGARGLADRWRGAVKLLKCQAALTALQLALLVAGLIWARLY
jgi:hypothetical protein